MNSVLTIVSLNNVSILTENFIKIWEDSGNSNANYISVGSKSDTDTIIRHLARANIQQNVLIHSAIPVARADRELSEINEMFFQDDLEVHFPVNLICPSVIRTSFLQIHLSVCIGCKCSLHEIVQSFLDMGFRQLFIPCFAIINDFNVEELVAQNDVLKKYLRMLKILQSGIELWIDGEMINPANTGTNNAAIDLICEVQKSSFVTSLTVILPEETVDRTAQLTERNIRYLDRKSLRNRIGFNSILFRPNQSWRDSWLRPEWNYFDSHIQWWLDFIAFEIPIYGGSWQGFQEIRNSAKNSFNEYDSTFFLSEATKKKYWSLTDKNPANFSILPCSVNTPKISTSTKNTRKILVLGNSMHHKGRIFALKLFEELLKLDGNYRLILAGPNPPFASSLEIERKFLDEKPNLKAQIEFNGALTNDELEHVLLTSEAVLCTSILEGFGLVPFEASTFGTIPFTTKVDFWSDTLKPEVWIDIHNLEESARNIHGVLSSDQKRFNQLEAFSQYSLNYTWTTASNKAIIEFSKSLVDLKFINTQQKDSLTTRVRIHLKRYKTVRKIYKLMLAIKHAI